MIALLIHQFALLTHESRMLTRRAIWPAALTIHAIAVSAFVGIWGPTGGVPLWDASTLSQLTGAERISAAVLLTWLTTFVLTDDDDGRRGMRDWSALTGQPVERVFSARLILAALLALVFVSVSAPAFAGAGASAAARGIDIAAQAGIALGFAIFSVGVTAVAGVALDSRVAVWCTAMVISLVAAVGVQALDTVWLRIAAPAAGGVVLMILALAGVHAQTQRHAD